MLLESLLGDGSLARTHIKRSWVFIGKLLTDSLEAARKAGHLVDRQNKDQDPETLELMLSHQLVVMAHCMRFLPDQPILGPELGHSDEMIDRTVVFLLRGLGFKEGAIKKLLHPDKILARFRKKIPL